MRAHRSEMQKVWKVATDLAAAGLRYPGNESTWRRIVENDLEADYMVDLFILMQEDATILDAMISIADDVAESLLEDHGLD